MGKNMSKAEKRALDKKKQQEKKTRTFGIAAVFVCLAIVLGMIIPKHIAPKEKEVRPPSNAKTTTSSAANKSENEAAGDKNSDSKPANPDTVTATIDIKDYGTITVELDPSAAPKSVENFVSLAESGFYDGLTFHRIMEGFMMQGGDPTGTGMGGSEETIPGEFATNGFDNPLSHTRGAISMARSGDPNSASSQFFIVHKDSTFLDGSYACFGYVTDGIEIVDAVCTDAEPIDGNGTIPPEAQPIINSIKIIK